MNHLTKDEQEQLKTFMKSKDLMNTMAKKFSLKKVTLTKNKEMNKDSSQWDKDKRIKVGIDSIQLNIFSKDTMTFNIAIGLKNGFVKISTKELISDKITSVSKIKLSEFHEALKYIIKNSNNSLTSFINAFYAFDISEPTHEIFQDNRKSIHLDEIKKLSYREDRYKDFTEILHSLYIVREDYSKSLLELLENNISNDEIYLMTTEASMLHNALYEDLVEVYIKILTEIHNIKVIDEDYNIEYFLKTQNEEKLSNYTVVEASAYSTIYDIKGRFLKVPNSKRDAWMEVFAQEKVVYE